MILRVLGCNHIGSVSLVLSFQYIKLSSIKVDTRYTTTQQVVKLIGSHTISKVTVKIGDLKRTKMVRTINLYYNNRTVQAIVELKNKYVHHGVYAQVSEFDIMISGEVPGSLF